jgi:transcriptional regulator with XRE-family HTH domain
MQNKDIAAELGVHEVTVSRWRIGDRIPDRAGMLHIEAVLGWSVSEQMAAYDQELTSGDRIYAERFREFLNAYFGIPNENEVA